MERKADVTGQTEPAILPATLELHDLDEPSNSSRLTPRHWLKSTRSTRPSRGTRAEPSRILYIEVLYRPPMC
jgi:hypothetical protein